RDYFHGSFLKCMKDVLSLPHEGPAVPASRPDQTLFHVSSEELDMANLRTHTRRIDGNLTKRHSNNRRALALAAAAATLACGAAAHATTGQWVVNGGGSWSVSANWSGGVPNATDDVANLGAID